MGGMMYKIWTKTMKIKEINTKQELYDLFPKDAIGAEIGVCRGHNAMHLWHITKPKKLYLCDKWDDDLSKPMRHFHASLWIDDNKSIVESMFKREIANGTVVIYHRLGGGFLSSLENDHLDWIYLDGDHNYDPVRIELTLSIDKVKPGGIIAGHDYCSIPGACGTGVIRAVNEFIQQGLLVMEAISTERNSSFLCRVNK